MFSSGSIRLHPPSIRYSFAIQLMGAIESTNAGACNIPGRLVIRAAEDKSATSIRKKCYQIQR